MKKIFLFAYTKTNLGDDIFLKMLVEKYPDNQFYINISNLEDRKVFGGIKNINFIENEPDNRNLNSINVDLYDAFIYIGGSIFIESERAIISRKKFNEFIDRCNKNNKPFFYVSSNFGPYKTEEYLRLSEKTMNSCTDICFRDKYSYNLFSKIPGARYAPDLVFSYAVGEVFHEKDSVGISVIDFDIRDELKEFSDKYYKLLAKTIISYVDNLKKIYLFSFCKFEGDEAGIEKLITYLPEEYKEKINIVKYTGNVNGFMEIYKKMEYMICTRFHSMILSLICGQKICCLSYSKKMNNVAEDLKLNIKIENIKELTAKYIDLNELNLVDNSKIDVCKEEAKEQLNAVNKELAQG